jgi:phosphoribosyl 1,2-cyclic phosphodiesterase
MKLHALASGSSGNSYCIETDTDLIFMDIGVRLCDITSFMAGIDNENKRLSLFLTHEHTDHISGLASFMRKYSPRVYSSAGTARALADKVDLSSIFVLQRSVYYDTDSFAVVPFDISHDAAEPFGYVVMTAQGNAGFATDLGCVTDQQLRYLEDSDILVLESNHDKEMLRKGSYPAYLKRRIASHKGHLSNDDTMAALACLHTGNLKHCLLAHVSKENNSHEILERYRLFCESNYGLRADILEQQRYVSFEVNALAPC